MDRGQSVDYSGLFQVFNRSLHDVGLLDNLSIPRCPERGAYWDHSLQLSDYQSYLCYACFQHCSSINNINNLSALLPALNAEQRGHSLYTQNIHSTRPHDSDLRQLPRPALRLLLPRHQANQQNRVNNIN